MWTRPSGLAEGVSTPLHAPLLILLLSLGCDEPQWCALPLSPGTWDLGTPTQMTT